MGHDTRTLKKNNNNNNNNDLVEISGKCGGNDSVRCL